MKESGNLSLQSLNGRRGLTLNAFYGCKRDMNTSRFSDLFLLKGR